MSRLEQSERPDSSVDAETMGRKIHHAESGRVLAFGRRVECPVCCGNSGRFQWVSCGHCRNLGSVLVPVLREVKS